MADAALGDVLSDAGLGLMKGLMGPSWAEEKAARAEAEAKAISERKRIESQTKLYEAEALYNARRQGPSTRPFKMGNGLGVLDENGLPVQVWEGPEKTPNESELVKGAARRQMERIIGKKYGLETLPISAWKDADWAEPALDPLRDFAGVGRSPLVTTPGGPGAETRPKRDIGGYGVKPAGGGTPARTPSSVEPDAAGPTSVRPAPAPAKSSPTGAPTVPPTSRKPAPEPVTKGAGDVVGEADPQIVKYYNERWVRLRDTPNMGRKEVDVQWKLLQNMPEIQPVNLASAAQAYHEVFGEPPPGWRLEGEPQGKAVGGAPAKAETPAVTPPTDTTSRTSLPPITPPPKPVTWGRERAEPLNNEQLTAKAYEAWQRQKEWEVAEQGRLMAERQLLKDEEARDLRALGGEPTPELREMTLKLNASGKVQGKDFTKLRPDEQQLVIDTKNLPKRRKEEQSWKKLAQPAMDELNALQTAQDLTTMILPLIHNGTVGFLGKASGVATWLRSHVMRNRFYTEAEAKLNATPEGKALLAKLGQRAVDAQVAADVETNDPQVRADMSKIATRARLQTLSSVLMYAHALAQKRITGGSQRGLIKPDMDEAHKLFDPDLFFTAPEQLMANLQTLQGVIQAARGRVEDNVRSYHFTPVIGIQGRLNWKYQPDEVEGEAPASPAPTESTDDRVRRGPSVR